MDPFKTRVSRLLQEVGKTASNTEPGSSHPSAKLDGNMNPATEGSHASELTSEVKKVVGAPSVETGENKPVEPDGNETSVGGLKARTTGNDTVPDPKAHPEDPGTSLSATNVEDNKKYGSMKFAHVRAHVGKQADNLLAKLTLEMNRVAKHASAQAAAAPAAVTPKVAAAVAEPTPEELQAAANAGYELGKTAGDTNEFDLDYISNLMSDADLAADLTAQFVKRAEEEEESNSEEAGAATTAVGDDPEADAGSSPVAGAEDAMASMMGGDPMAAAGGGGVDPMAAMGGGGDPMAAMGGGGGDPMAGGGDVPLSQASPEELLAALTIALSDRGMAPEELPGAVPPGAADMGAKMAAANKIASAVKQYKRDGKFRSHAPKTAEQSRRQSRLVENVHNYLGELLR